jgi:Kef-type K+ transport system membrane component KefB
MRLSAAVSRLLGVLLLLATAFTVRVLAGAAPADEAAEATMVLGFVLVVSYFAGRVAARLSFPSITGYLGVGILFGPYVLAPLSSGLTIITEGAAGGLRLLDGAALGLIALTAGGELKLAKVRAKRRVIAWVVGAQAGIVGLGVGAVMLAVFTLWGGLPTTALGATVVAALLLGVTAVATSPATTIAVIREYEAKGPVADLALAVTVAKDVVLVTLFTVALALALMVMDAGGVGIPALALRTAWEILGSLVLGVGLGWVLAQYARWVRAELPLLVLALAFVSGGLTEHYHLSGLLMCMVAGFYVENFSEQGHTLIQAVEAHARPLYIIFFTMAGAALHFEALARTWPVALGLTLSRLLFMFLGTALATRITGEPKVVQRYGFSGFIGQAGVTLGFAAVLADRLPVVGTTLYTVIVAAVAIHELTGPILFRWGLTRAGEASR